MKNIRYILLAICLFAAMSVGAQWQTVQNEKQHNSPEQQETPFKSTSVMPQSGSKLPQAAKTGPTIVNEPEMDPAASQVKRKGGRPGDWTDPYKDPIGELPLALMLLLSAAYALHRKKDS